MNLGFVALVARAVGGRHAVGCRRTAPSRLTIRLQIRQTRCRWLSPTRCSSRDGDPAGWVRRMMMPLSLRVPKGSNTARVEMAPISVRTAASALSLVPVRQISTEMPASDAAGSIVVLGHPHPSLVAMPPPERALQNELGLTPPTGVSYVTYRVRMSQGQEHIQSVA